MTTVAGSASSPQAVADAAAMRPTAAGLRTEISPLSPRAFRAPVARYRAYAAREADAMQAPVGQLATALRRGDRGAAQAAWGRACDRYLLLGAAYRALGPLDRAIDGMPGGLRRGVADRRFAGLHRLEHGLWTGAPLASLVPWAVKLARDVHTLRRVVRTIPITPLDYATRAHEILEDAQRDLVSGRAAPWSGAGVRATADASAATAAVVGTLVPLLQGRGDALPPVQYGLRRLDAELASVRRDHGGRWPATGALTRAQHERVDGRLGAVLESLAAVPGALETQLPRAIPALPALAAPKRAATR
ncbi:MAG: EfeM/EfeO family lipoprotein [Conexibacter sp.]|nr:EfeM/EfeO family lipoprotein [Conexibacter sp.]